MMPNLQVSFQGSDEWMLFTTIHNPEILPAGLHRQIMRFGLTGPTSTQASICGTLKSSRRAFIEMIMTYGLTVQVIAHKDLV